MKVLSCRNWLYILIVLSITLRSQVTTITIFANFSKQSEGNKMKLSYMERIGSNI